MNTPDRVMHGASALTDHDIYLFKQGKHFRLYEKLGAHVTQLSGLPGVHFAVWAPSATKVFVVGDFNNWNPKSHQLDVRYDESGIWEGFVPGAKVGEKYKFRIITPDGAELVKGDPLAHLWEDKPEGASVVWDLSFNWNDEKWMASRHKRNALTAPMSVYEIHLGSWRRNHDEGFRSLHYGELAHSLPGYLKELGFTHVEFLPVMEHPFFGSWGYQTTGFFAPSSRFGPPSEFMQLVEALHNEGIGVILDWVPSHFPTDSHGLWQFDGTHLYEHADPKKGFHPDWNSAIFNYGRHEVRSFLISSALFWLDRYHADGIRVDAVASMLYLDYSREEGQWIPNEHGGRENLEAISFLRELNETVYREYPDVQTVAEESTAWPMVSRPAYIGGLGFGLKWNMGWMHDTLDYASLDPIFRKFNQEKLTFSIWYAFNENFMLPLSHDEVVHGKGSLYGRMPGDGAMKCAGLRQLYAFMYAHPGKKLLFMGGEIGQVPEWNHDAELEWHLLDVPWHKGVFDFLKDLNALYKKEPALYENDFDPSGFRWVDFHDAESSVISFVRYAPDAPPVLAVFNFTPVCRQRYRVGVPHAGQWSEQLNSDAAVYGGSDVGNYAGATAQAQECHGCDYSITLDLPPMGALLFRHEG